MSRPSAMIRDKRPQCNICRWRIQDTTLRMHKIEWHRRKTIVLCCPECKHCEVRSTAMSAHMSNIHFKAVSRFTILTEYVIDCQPYIQIVTCLFCTFRTTHAHNLRRHLRIHHSDDYANMCQYQLFGWGI